MSPHGGVVPGIGERGETAMGLWFTVVTFAALPPGDSCNQKRWTTSLQCIELASDMQNENRGSITPPARDPNLAIEEEYHLALRQGTVQALELFIARHPEGPFAEKAREDLRRRTR